jgi:hypothetical protein
MTLIDAQQRYIDRVNGCHPGHQRRVKRSARLQLSRWAERRGFNSAVVVEDADDMARLEANSDD